MAGRLDLRRRVAATTVNVRAINPAQLSPASNQRICLVCTNKEAAYCCPRCFKPYCSVPCYKSHDILCTEEFNRENVEAVLTKEKEMQVHSDSRSIPQSKDSRISSGETEEYYSSNEKKEYPCIPQMMDSRISADDTEEDYCSNDKEEYPLLDEGKVEELMTKLSAGKDTLTDDELRALRQITNSSFTKNFLKGITLRKQFWETGALSIEEKHHLNTEVECVLEYFRSEINNSRKTSFSEGNDPLLLQLLGLFLGYVVMMRTLNGTWVGSLKSELYEHDATSKKEDSQLDCEALQNHCLESLQLLLQSTPFLSTSFRPLTVDAAVQAWIYCNPPSLITNCEASNLHHEPSRHHALHVTKAILQDITLILSSVELTIFTLLDCWLLGRLCESLPNLPLSCKSCISLAGHPPLASESYASGIISLLKEYKSYYSGPTKMTNKSGKKRSSGVMTADKFTRKCFFLICHFVGNTSRKGGDGSRSYLSLQNEIMSYASDILNA